MAGTSLHMTAPRPDAGTPVYAVFGEIDAAAPDLAAVAASLRPIPFEMLVALETGRGAVREEALEAVRALDPRPLAGATSLDDYWNGALSVLNPGFPLAEPRALVVDKGALYARLRERKVPVPDFLIGQLTPILLAEAASRLGPAPILKPATGTGSSGVVRYREDLSPTANLELYRITLNLAQIDSATPTIAMRYVGGPDALEVSAELVVDAGVCVSTVVHEKGTATDLPPYLDRIMTSPPTHPGIIDARPALDESLAALVAALELGRGVVHAELRLDDGRWHVLDVAVRPGGGFVTHSVHARTGYDPHLLQLLACLGLPFPERATAAPRFPATAIACCYATDPAATDLARLNAFAAQLDTDPAVIGWHLSASSSRNVLFGPDAGLSIGVGAPAVHLARQKLAELTVAHGFS